MKKIIPETKCLKCGNKFKIEVRIDDNNRALVKCPYCKNENVHDWAEAIWCRTLRNAEKLLTQGEFRSAVVESFSAWEILIPTAIRFWFKENNSDQKIQNIIFDLMGKSRSREINNVIFESLWQRKINKQKEEEVAKLRNDVVHKGIIPTEKKTSNSINTIWLMIFDLFNENDMNRGLLHLDKYW